MGIGASMLPEFDAEIATTRRVLERVPCDQLEWRPHPKSFTMQQLATHLSEMPTWMLFTIEQDAFNDAEQGDRERFVFTTNEELLAHFDESVARARAALESVTDERILGPWSLIAQGKTIFTLPRAAVLRSFVMNHMIHHRAQLGLYLRMTDVPVPSMYGPTADEPGF